MHESFLRTCLWTLSGPLIWAMHFLFIYATHGLFCARPPRYDDAMPTSFLVIIGAGALALVAMTLIYRGLRPNPLQTANPKFLRWLAAALSLLSGLAVVWETLPLIWLPAC